MLVTRFCSFAEYNKFVSGETLVNTADHYRGGRGGSTSKGFCFTADEPKTAWRYLKGIVDCDICMVLDIDERLFTKSSGKYADYSKPWTIAPQSCLKREYCLKEYSLSTATLVKTLQPTDFATEAELEAMRAVRNFFHTAK